MSHNIREDNDQERPYNVIVEEDPEQEAFEEALERWVEGKISYEEMYEKVPYRGRTTLKKIARIFA